MDALFESAPLFVPLTPYAKAGDHRAAERELRQGELRINWITPPLWLTHWSISPGTFIPGDLTEKVGTLQDEEEKSSAEHYESGADRRNSLAKV